MARKVMAILLFAYLSGGLTRLSSALPAPLPKGDDGLKVYLPIVGHQGPIKVVVTTWNDDPYGYSYHTLGYLENITSGSFKVTLEAVVTVYPYSIDTPVPPYTKTVQFEPSLYSTLPSQHNPFSLESWCYKGCEVVTAVRVAQAIPQSGAYFPLTITTWTYQNGILSGKVRNDTSKALDHARVVAADLQKCEWKEAELNAVYLQPGQETTFTVNPYYSYCFNEQMLVVGQGYAP